MMASVTSLNHLTLAVGDVQRSLAFYRDMLGCRLRAHWPEGAYLKAGSFWICLSHDPAARAAPHPDYSHIAFSVSERDFPILADRIRRDCMIWKDNRSEGASVYFLDPDGHKLELHVGSLESRLKLYAADASPVVIVEPAPGSQSASADIEEIEGACHCGAVRFQVRLSDGLRTARRCDCSYCRMRGAVAVTTALDDLVVTAGREMLSLYQFGSMTAKHHFCSRCGIHTFHQRRSNPTEFGVNVACLSGISPFDFPEMPVNDGIHHPADAGDQRSSLAGLLRYEKINGP